MLATLSSATLIGVESLPVQIEVNTGEIGDPRIIMVGLPDAAVKESGDRVLSALGNSGFRQPETRTVVNLAPGDLRKEGAMFDLPIALGILASMDQIDAPRLNGYLIAGELGLSGETRPVRGALSMAMMAKRQGKSGVILPVKSAREAALVEGIDVFAVRSLDEAVAFLTDLKKLEPIASPLPEMRSDDGGHYGVDFAEVKGQENLRRAVEVAVAGGHNLLMIGPPGSGKSMIAKRIPTIMPAPTLDEFLEILRVHSAAGNTLRDGGEGLRRPFRSPHHTISDAGLIGGGTIPGPGEISLAHHGVLFLDELPEFKRSALEVMRQPLEDGDVTISRSAAKITLPCSFMLVAAMNPCPCGYLGDGKRECRCNPVQVQRYRARISGPMLDRIDIHVEAPALSIQELRSQRPSESSGSLRERIAICRTRQVERLGGEGITSNARMSHRQIRKHCALDAALGDLLQQAMDQLNLSARAYDRILKVARTIADLAGADAIESAHLLEAIQYRSLDRTVFY